MNGIVYILIGTGGLDEELYKSIRSVQKNSGQKWPIRIYWGGYKPHPPSGVDLIEADITEIKGSQRLAHRMVKAQLYRNPPFANTLFLDTDTFCVGDLTGIFEDCDKFVRGIPDGRMPNPMNMMKWMFKGGDYIKCGKLSFGDKYLEAKDKPTAWNVGVFPLNRKMAQLFSFDFLNITNFFAYRATKEIYDAYKLIFDEQIPLNFCLWKNNVPTKNMDTRWNITKTKLASSDPKKAKIIHIRIKTKECERLAARYINIKDLV